MSADTSAAGAADRTAIWRVLADAYADIDHEGIAGCLRQACDLIETLTAERDAAERFIARLRPDRDPRELAAAVALHAAAAGLAPRAHDEAARMADVRAWGDARPLAAPTWPDDEGAGL